MEPISGKRFLKLMEGYVLLEKKKQKWQTIDTG